MAQNRIIAYVDGFNLYNGLKEANFQKFLWLDIKKLIKFYIAPKDVLVRIKYFTSLEIGNDWERKERQKTYLEALGTLSDFEIIYGLFYKTPFTCKFYDPSNYVCHGCTGIMQKRTEKMTDVKIAIEMIDDLINDRFDIAILVSGDTDFIPVIEYIHKIKPDKIVTVFFPPKRNNGAVTAVAKGHTDIGRKRLKDSQFPIDMQNKIGDPLHKPVTWV